MTLTQQGAVPLPTGVEEAEEQALVLLSAPSLAVLSIFLLGPSDQGGCRGSAEVAFHPAISSRWRCSHIPLKSWSLRTLSLACSLQGFPDPSFEILVAERKCWADKVGPGLVLSGQRQNKETFRRCYRS